MYSKKKKKHIMYASFNDLKYKYNIVVLKIFYWIYWLNLRVRTRECISIFLILFNARLMKNNKLFGASRIM